MSNSTLIYKSSHKHYKDIQTTVVGDFITKDAPKITFNHTDSRPDHLIELELETSGAPTWLNVHLYQHKNGRRTGHGISLDREQVGQLIDYLKKQHEQMKEPPDRERVY